MTAEEIITELFGNNYSIEDLKFIEQAVIELIQEERKKKYVRAKKQSERKVFSTR